MRERERERDGHDADRHRQAQGIDGSGYDNAAVSDEQDGDDVEHGGSLSVPQCVGVAGWCHTARRV